MRIFILIWLAFCCKLHAQQLHVNGQASAVFFEQPDVLKNAGVKKVRSLFKDSRQLIWIGTDNGLYRYDGTNVVFIKHRPNDTTSIPDNTITSISEDFDGMIWIGTLAGVARLDPFTLGANSFRSALHNLRGDYDNHVFISRDGNVWAGNSQGLERFSHLSHRFEPVWIPGNAAPRADQYVTGILQFHKDSLLLGTFSDIVAINIHNYRWRRKMLHPSGVTVTAMLYDANHNIWIGTWGRGLFILDSTMGATKSSLLYNVRKPPCGDIVSSLVESDWPGRHSVWIDGSEGIYKVACDGPGVRPDLKRGLYISTAAIKKDVSPGMITDKDGFVWFASPHGVFKFPAGRDYFKKLPVTISGTVVDIQKLNVNSKSRLYISTWYGREGLIRTDESGRNVSTYRESAGQGSVRDAANVSTIGQDRYGRLWVPSLAGLAVTDANMHVIHDFSRDTGVNKLHSNKVSGVFFVHDTAWVICYKGGIDLFDLSFHKLKHFSAGSSGLREDLVWRVLADSSGRTWVCGNSYFYRYLPDKTAFTEFDFSKEQSNYAPVDMAQLPNGHLVIATRIGLIDLDPDRGTFERITSPLLQKEEIVQSVTVDTNGDPWFVTASHLVHYQPSSGQFTLFDEEDGLDTKNELQWLRSFDGHRFFLAQQHALITFNPSEWETEITAPYILMHVIQVNDSTIRPGSLHDTLRLSYDQNKIYLEFDGVNFVKPAQNQYAYMLAGVDKAWSFTNRNIASYANLAPGRYVFRVKAGNYAGLWGKERDLYIFIRPPFWKTWWFISLTILAISSLFFFIVRYVSQRNLIERILRLEKEQAVEKERNRIARDMHDDLGSGLTKIAILSEVAKTQLQHSTNAEAQLENISRSSRELLDNLQDIIWVLNPRNDSLESLAIYTREHASRFLEGLDIDLRFKFPATLPAIKFTEEERRNIFLVIKETLNNIAKHAQCTAIDIELEVLQEKMQMVIKDNGRGFDEEGIREFANGLKNMRYRMDQIGGSYKIDACPGKGTVTVLSVPI